MDYKEDRKFVGRLIYSVLTEQICVREAIKLFPDTQDLSVECAFHALVHFEADEDFRYKNIEYKDVQDEYLEYLAEVLSKGEALPKNIIDEYKAYYGGTVHKWTEGLKGFFREFRRYINIK